MINKTLSIGNIHIKVSMICFVVIITDVYYSKLLVMVMVRDLNKPLCLGITHILFSLANKMGKISNRLALNEGLI